MRNPLDEYFEEGVGKQASFMDSFARGAKSTVSGHELGRFAAGTGLIVGAGMLINSAHKAYDAATKGADFKKMLEVNPDLVEHSQQNPKMFNQYYSSLRTLNQEFARDPVVAGQYMRQMSLDPTNAGGPLIDASRHAVRSQGGARDFSSALDLVRHVGPASPVSMDMLRIEELRKKSRETGGYSVQSGEHPPAL